MPGVGRAVPYGKSVILTGALVSLPTIDDLPRVGRPDQQGLAGTLRRQAVRVDPAAALLGRLLLAGLAEFLDLAFEVGLLLLAGLVLGDGAEHLLQRGQLLGRRVRLAVLAVCLDVVGREVQGHTAALYQRERTWETRA